MDEDTPNFSYAHAPDTKSSAPSWNPALRTDHESLETAPPVASHELQPSPQIIPQSKPVLEDGQDDDEDDVPIIPHAPTLASNGHDESDVSEEGSASSQESGGEEMERRANGTANAVAQAAEEEEDEMDESSSEESPELHYEHQGETTLLEEAMAESEKAPLVADTESATDDWGASGEVFDLGGMPQDAPVETPLEPPMQTPAAAGTTVGDEMIGNTQVGGNTGEDIDWGNADGEDFFRGAVNQVVEPAQPTDLGAGAHVVQESEPKQAGGDSMWDLDMDDDFLPEESAPIFELDDDEGFLEDEPASASEQPVQQASVPSTTRYTPTSSPALQSSTSPYGAPSPQHGSFAQLPQKASAPSPYSVQSQPSLYQQPPRPPLQSSAESFADKNKGGYHSPYDLPEDIVATSRRRAAPRAAPTPATQPSAPPRTSSMSSTGPRPLPPSNMSASSLSPPSSGHSMQAQMTGLLPNAPPKPAAPAKAPSGDFFAELPVTSKPRPSGRYTPQHSTPQHPPAYGLPPKERTASWSSLRNELRPEADNLIAQLQQPERLPVFPDQPMGPPARANSLPVPQPATAPPSNRYSPAPAQPPSAPATNARYSPAPPPAPGVNTRYSPAPPPQGPVYGSTPPSGPPRPQSQPYAPRTSSPLAFHPVSQREDVAAPTQEPQIQPSPKAPLEGVAEVDEQPQTSAPPIAPRSETPPLRSGASSAVSSPKKRSNYMPQYQPPNPPSAASSLVSPPRARSHSPTAVMKQPHRHAPSTERVGSVPAPMSPPSAFGSIPATQHVNSIPPRRQPSLQYESIVPNDERAADPLERWKGAPVFTWGLGGTIITTFPKQIPRYGGGASAPMMKSSPGEIIIHNVKEALPLADETVKFPGPLKAKSKKKDVSVWLGRRIESFEEQLKTPGIDQTLSSDEMKRLAEKALLWKVLQVFIDNDGHLEGNPTIEAAVRNIFSSGTDTPHDGEATLLTAADLVGTAKPTTSAVQADPIDPQSVEELRRFLTKGEREKAVWHAVDQRLWAHAMLLSSTLSKDVWKQVVQEFVRKEVKKIGASNQALAVLYEIFAGNHEDCIDELVPVSARAGFQMMSAGGAGISQNALQGLEKWQETLSLVLNNRSEGDTAALVSLGKLLAGYGRVEAAHICFIFARSAAHIGGVDDAQADMVLIGADHRQNPNELGLDLDAVLLTEVYEFGLSLAAQSGSYIIPHLQNYKLTHAYQLAEYGQRTEAQTYCDAIAASMKATTRISPYYNASFVATLDDLSKRLSESPKDGSTSWMSKPSMDKVSSSLLSKFNSFIAGDDEDAASNKSTGEAGPFGKIAGTPTLSPVQSSADLYGAYSGFGAPLVAPSGPTNSRYAPSSTYAPNASKYEPQGRSSLESADGAVGMRSVSDSYMPSPQLSSPYMPSQPQLIPAGHQPQLSKSHSYSPLRSEYNAAAPPYGSLYQPTPPTEDRSSSFGGYEPPQPGFDTSPTEPTQQSTGYEPPSYTPYQPEEEASAEKENTLKPKKSFMELDDEDDDLAARAASLKTKQKSDADRQADEAFRKAAEEDAKRDKDAAAAKKSGGWFGGWFKKDDATQQPKAIKAKLGEENSFVYDPEQKRWVNKKAGAQETGKSAATPPPPRGPPGRSVSSNAAPPPGAMGPPSSVPNQMNGLGLSAPPTSNPRSSSMPPPMVALPSSRASTPGVPSDTEGGKPPPTLMRPNLPGGSGPPSRPGTGMSTASSIDDLLGAPAARKGPGGGKKKKGRYVDVMAKD